jgi:hypothetical protein
MQRKASTGTLSARDVRQRSIAFGGLLYEGNAAKPFYAACIPQIECAAGRTVNASAQMK